MIATYSLVKSQVNTKHSNNLYRQRPEQRARSLQLSLQFCSCFELHDRNLGKLHVASKIVSVQNCLDVAQAMTGEGRDLRYCCVDQGQPYNCRPAQIMKGQALNARLGACLRPGCSESVRGPRFSMAPSNEDQDNRKKRAVRDGTCRGKLVCRVNQDRNRE